MQKTQRPRSVRVDETYRKCRWAGGGASQRLHQWRRHIEAAMGPFPLSPSRAPYPPSTGVCTPLQLAHALLQRLVEQPPACLPAWPPSGLALLLPLLADGADASAVLCTLCYVLRGVLDEFVLDEGEPEWAVGVAVALDPAWCTGLNAKQQRYALQWGCGGCWWRLCVGVKEGCWWRLCVGVVVVVWGEMIDAASLCHGVQGRVACGAARAAVGCSTGEASPTRCAVNTLWISAPSR